MVTGLTISLMCSYVFFSSIGHAFSRHSLNFNVQVEQGTIRNGQRVGKKPFL